MIQSKFNQLANAKNPYQGQDRKVLCVCSAGLLRSPTIAKVLQAEFGYNVRACGVSQEYALVPISTALIEWADEIVCAEHEHYATLQREMPDVEKGRDVIVLALPDIYGYGNPVLEKHILYQYKEQVRDGADDNKTP